MRHLISECFSPLGWHAVVGFVWAWGEGLESRFNGYKEIRKMRNFQKVCTRQSNVLGAEDKLERIETPKSGSHDSPSVSPG